MSGFNQILVPVDYSPPSTAALRLAGEIAGAFRGHLTVLLEDYILAAWG